MPGGRPPRYQAEFAEQGRNYCLLGATDEELALWFGVAERTINRWKADHPEFRQALKEGKAIADAAVARGLYERAKGFTLTMKVPVKLKVAKDVEKVELVEIARDVPPDTTAGIYWLKNRRRENWRDTNKIEPPKPAEAPAEFDDASASAKVAALLSVAAARKAKADKGEG